ncbi:MAG: PaaX family transcriptional regulator [Sciscionella sp.]
MTRDTVPQPLPLPSARSLLVTVLGDLVYSSGRPVWTSTVIETMRLLGVEEQATRQAIRRSAGTGWIQSERHGKAVAWHLTPQGRELAEEGIRRSQEFVRPPTKWDGRWFSLTVSTTDLSKTTRRRLQGALTWLRLGNLLPGIWVSPRAGVAHAVRDVVNEFGLSNSAVGVTGRIQVGLDGQEIARRAWDLTELQDSYQRLLSKYRDLEPQDADELLIRYLEILNLMQRFMRLDPRLPKELHPRWIGREAAELLGDRAERWAEPAHRRWMEISKQTAP